MAVPSSQTPVVLSGPARAPKQMLAGQDYAGHASIHDDRTAAALGFTAGPIEGPTHFSQFVPLLIAVWGEAWLETGCLSAHFRTPAYEGEAVTAFAELPHPGARHARIRLAKADGTEVLRGTASSGPGHGETELGPRLAAARAPRRPELLDRLSVGDRTAPEAVRMGFDGDNGPTYPFSLRDKLAAITEPSTWYDPATAPDSPWGVPIVPMEMVSVLAHRTVERAFPIRQPSVALFLDLEIRMLRGPLRVDADYRIEREIVGLGESRRTESAWIRTEVRPAAGGDPVARLLLHLGVLKGSRTAAGGRADAS